MNLYVIRHGQTEWNVSKKMQGIADIPLNDKGKNQAHAIKETLNTIQFDIIYCSPLTRAKQTAEIINANKKYTIIYDERLKERNYGEFEGIAKTSFNYNDFWAYKKNINYKKAENIQSFFNRVYAFIDEIKNRNEKNVLIICHAGVEKAIECYIKGLMDDNAISSFLPDNASVLKYDL